MGRKSRDAEGERVFSRLAEVREACGLSRSELADAVGVHYQTVGYLERGEYSPSLVLALRISAALSTPLEHIFSVSPFPRDQECGP
jgi:DNA-binding XRE family transcriptional regulator